jgi:hypothetical protein
MRPGGWHTTAMLSADESLRARIAADVHTLQSLGLNAGALGRRLGELIEAGRDSDWFAPSEAHEFRIELRKRRGIMTCPWAPEEFASCGQGDGGKRAGANHFFVRNATNSQMLEGFVLSAHLIAEHDFFGGIDTPFRIDPDRLAEVLGRIPTEGT